MKIDQTGYAVPWASVIIKNGDVFLNGEFDIDDSSGGTAQLKITRTQLGYDLDFSKVEDYNGFTNSLAEKVRCCLGSKIEDWIKVGNVTAEYRQEQMSKT